MVFDCLYPPRLAWFECSDACPGLHGAPTQAFNKTIGVPALRSGAVSVHKHTPTEVKLPPATQDATSARSNNGSGNNSSSSEPASASSVIVGNARGVQALRKSRSDRGTNEERGPETEGK